jgi:Zn finger protein HypA/HybF involved in hydrogenase expression
VTNEEDSRIVRLSRLYSLGEQIIHCLKCDHTYTEQEPVVDVCPDCGNEDMMETVYLQGG